MKKSDAEIKKDSLRVDWLTRNPDITPYTRDGLWCIPYLIHGGNVGELTGKTFREVIDLAIKAEAREMA